jgi:hypothetical protein
VWNIGGLGCRLGQMDGTIKVSCRAVGTRLRGRPVRAGGWRAGRGVAGSRKTWPLSLTSAPRLRAVSLLCCSGGESHFPGRPARLPAEGDFPLTPCAEVQSAAPSHPAARRDAGGGGVKPGDPERRSESRGGDHWVYHPTQQPGRPGPGAGHSSDGQLPLARGRKRRGRGQQPPPARFSA